MLIDRFEAADLAHWRWPHFSPAELACHCGGKFCCGEYWHDTDFLNALETLRAAIGRPLAINSGHRCDGWNREVGGVPGSMHRTLAVDISLNGHDRHVLLAVAIDLGFAGIGFGKTFLHLDRRADPARWFYKGSRASWQT